MNYFNLQEEAKIIHQIQSNNQKYQRTITTHMIALFIVLSNLLRTWDDVREAIVEIS